MSYDYSYRRFDKKTKTWIRTPLDRTLSIIEPKTFSMRKQKTLRKMDYDEDRLFDNENDYTKSISEIIGHEVNEDDDEDLFISSPDHTKPRDDDDNDDDDGDDDDDDDDADDLHDTFSNEKPYVASSSSSSSSYSYKQKPRKEFVIVCIGGNQWNMFNKTCDAIKKYLPKKISYHNDKFEFGQFRTLESTLHNCIYFSRFKNVIFINDIDEIVVKRYNEITKRPGYVDLKMLNVLKNKTRDYAVSRNACCLRVYGFDVSRIEHFCKENPIFSLDGLISLEAQEIAEYIIRDLFN